jgi:hypothetical protein
MFRTRRKLTTATDVARPIRNRLIDYESQSVSVEETRHSLIEFTHCPREFFIIISGTTELFTMKIAVMKVRITETQTYPHLAFLIPLSFPSRSFLCFFFATGFHSESTRGCLEDDEDGPGTGSSTAWGRFESNVEADPCCR